MTPAPLRGVWSNPRPAAPQAPLSGWLVARIDEVGLDGSICAEFVLSLIDLYASSAAERDAAITEFLTDSVAASTLKNDALRARFVEETVAGIRSRIGGRAVVAAPAPPAPTIEAPQPAAASGAKQKGFKKGIKITGTALKEVVGNVKPSYVQRYSDDESSNAAPTLPITRLVSTASSFGSLRQQAIEVNSFPALETGMQTPQAGDGPARTTSSRRRNKAREIGPDEDWDDGDAAPTPWKTPAESPPTPAMKKKSTTKKQLTMTTVSPVVVVHDQEVMEVSRKSSSVCMEQTVPVVLVEAPQAAVPEPAAPTEPVTMTILDSLLLPQDILGFDFKFEGDDEVAHDEPAAASPEPFDLLKQMFSQSGFTTAPVLPETENQPSTGNKLDAEKRRYPVGYLLSVLKRMQDAHGGEIAVPDELRSLSQSTVVSPEHPAKGKQHDANWRHSHGSKTESPENNGTWRASGYNNRWNPKKRPETPPPAEEGFW